MAELVCRSAFSLSEGASKPDELVDRAVELGLHALAITDRDAVYGMPQAHRAAVAQRRAGHSIDLLCGALLTVQGQPGVALLAQNTTGWKHLCHLITQARCGGEAARGALDPRTRGTVKGRGRVPMRLLLEKQSGLEAIALGGWSAEALHELREAFGDRTSLAVVRQMDSLDTERLDARRALSQASGVPLVASNDVVMHSPARKPLHDVLTCIRLHCTLDQAGRALQPNAERHLKGPAELCEMFRGLEHALDRTVHIADRCTFAMDQLAYHYPKEIVPEGQSPMAWLTHLTEQGLAWRYPEGTPGHVRAQVDHELALIARMNFPAYFLTVHDAVRYAREQGILCQGRGSAANSAVCYALGITAVDPASSSLLFERFISEERGEPPDIDVDFEHERREEVIQYIYRKYGRHRAGMINEIIAYRRRSAVRDVGKALGLSVDQVDALAKGMHWFDAGPVARDDLTTAGLDPSDTRVQLTCALCDELQGFPRHIGIHVGGFSISDGPLVDLVPVEPATMPERTVIQWDKDDIDVVGFVKVDLLSLGMLTATRKAFDLVRQHWGRVLSLASVCSEDPAVYDMLCQADSIGVFQIESRAQQSMLPRLRPRCWYDLVIEVSIVRPGPIQGGMVHPYLARRNGEEPVSYAHPALEPILSRTLGVPIFQEQVMAMAVAVGDFTPGRADGLRRAMGAWRKRGGLNELTDELVQGMMKNGVQRDYAEQIAAQIQGFGEYGFPESHAASFARLVYVSAWLKCHYPAAFCAALLNSQPMGFYAPRTLIADAQRHGVEARGIDIDHSDWDCTLEPVPEAPAQPALRMGLRLVRGLREEAGLAIEAARKDRPFDGVGDLSRRARLRKDDLLVLARANVLRSLGPGRQVHSGEEPGGWSVTPGSWDRRKAAWAVQGMFDMPLFQGLMRDEAPAPIPEPDREDELREDYRTVGLSVDDHPLKLLRTELEARDFRTVEELFAIPEGTIVRVGGLVASRQRPGTASGMVFMSFEDETGQVNVVVRPQLFDRQRAVIVGRNLLEVTGRLQRQDEAVSVLAFRFAPLAQGEVVSARSRDFR